MYALAERIVMDTKATRALIVQFVDAWVNEDIAKPAALMSDDVVWVRFLRLETHSYSNSIGFGISNECSRRIVKSSKRQWEFTSRKHDFISHILAPEID